MFQGSPLSPLLSNVILNELDQKLEAKKLKFVRYGDDVLIFTKSSRKSERAMKLINRYLTDELSQFLNKKKSRVSSPMELKYLGFGNFLDKDAKWQLTAHSESVEKFRIKLEKLTQENLRLSLDAVNDKLKQSIEGWVVYFRIAKMEDVVMLLDDELRSWMRVFIWKQWAARKSRSSRWLN